MATIRANSLFTELRRTDDGDVWWEGMTEQPPGQPRLARRGLGRPRANKPPRHPNARFTVKRRAAPT
jgi:phosphoenolpyruvate carboxykinase (GTP)